METVEQIDRECAALGGLFQQVVNDMKAGVPHYEDFISKAGKLHSQLKCTILALGSFLDTFQKIADSATNTKGATKEIGSCLTRIVLRHKSMEARMKALCSALLDCLVLPLQDKLEEWKKVGHTLDKEHSKEFKKLRGELKKKSDNASRLIKKHKKSKGSASDPKVEQSVTEASKQACTLHEVEKCAVRRVLVEERSRYCTFISCMKPVLAEEISMVSEFQQLEEVLTKLDKHTEDPFKLPEASEQVLTDIKTSSGGVVFQTPPSSPSSLGSRKSSMCSISSAGSSSGGSSNSPSHQLNKNRQSANSLVGPMRLSSISSQDSGFTSQDTLFLRPGSPHRNKTPNGSDQELSGSGGSTPGGGGWARQGLVAGMPGPPLTDRPHTISSAYEKGGQHQRPALQPYTFNPPERIHEEDERPGSSSCDYEETASTSSGGQHKPPVPQRLSSTSRPSIPSKPVQFNSNGVPTFSCNQPDMVVPQPVYMNMSDMNAMSEARAGKVEDGVDLKTPTAEDLGGVGAEANEAVDGYCNGKFVLSSGGVQQWSGVRGHTILRPYSFTQGTDSTPPNHGVNNRGTILRRSMSQNCDKSAVVPQTVVQHQRNSLTGPQHHEPPPAPGTDELDGGGSNTTTPRGSMEFLPPPPPHLLHSDEETDDAGTAAATSSSGPSDSGVSSATTTLSVAESVRQIQQKQHMFSSPRPGSPSTLRRVQSMSAASPGPHHHPAEQRSSIKTDQRSSIKTEQRASLKARLDAALSSPRPGMMRPQSPGGGGAELIYAPVAALQQKIQQQQKTKLAAGHNQPGMVPHPPGPIIQHNDQVHLPQQTNSFHPGSPAPPPPQQHNTFQSQQQYIHQQQQVQQHQQIQQHHQQVPQHHQQVPQHHQQVPQHHQQVPQHHQQIPQHHQQVPQHHQQVPQHHQLGQPPQHFDEQGGGGSEYGFGMQFQVSAAHWYNQHQKQPQHQHFSHTMHNHDQIMQEMDPTLGQRPQPPALHSNGASSRAAAYDGSAQKVRQWIETRTVADVRKVRPILNQEIQRGFSLRKTIGVNDRSKPRF